MNFRHATPADAPLIAAMHVQSWRIAYAHIMDPAYLAGGIEANRLATWTQRLEAPQLGQRVIIAEREGQPIGFTCVIGGSDPRWGTLVDNLHALPAAKGSGIGTALLDQAVRWAIEGWPDAGLFLWCYTDNVAARGFYAARGGVEVEDWDKPGPDGRTLAEKRIAWRDPRVLMRS
ncbi:GNAT family N-acetyltransferase [Sphingobium sp. BYY-5]|uniref:GNAT family N-acetyltransferase n=1 Tax=Sphingobium sp. BYY-5 TaxID=2926400 RepID=UPI001FA80FA3|nr:GNAT family N-acetyltransferase [Sphingobium sp. BYY-5]MCI4591516.1 GNAT family N-acetyltransferase [Sphingobium sp. BYY-5]